VRHTLEEECFGCLEEPHLSVLRGNGFEFSISDELVAWVVCVEYCAKQGGEVCFKPYLGCWFVSIVRQSPLPNETWSTHFSPRKSTT
jgi:hypothetical protein